MFCQLRFALAICIFFACYCQVGERGRTDLRTECVAEIHYRRLAFQVGFRDLRAGIINQLPVLIWEEIFDRECGDVDDAVEPL